MKKTLFLIIIALVCINVTAENYQWRGGGEDNNWLTPANWTNGTSLAHTTSPTSGDYIELRSGDFANGMWPVVMSGANCSVYHIFMGMDSAAGLANFAVENGATLGVTPNGIHVGYVDDGEFNTAGNVTISGGLFLGDGNADWGYAHGTMNVSGGIVTSDSLNFGMHDSSGNYVGGDGELFLMAGVLDAQVLRGLSQSDSVIDIYGGEFKLAGDVRTEINALVESKKIRGYSKNGAIVVAYDSGSNKTIISAQLSQVYADINNDAIVDGNDLWKIVSEWLSGGCGEAWGDVDGDCDCNASDFALVLGNLGNSESLILGYGLTVSPSGQLMLDDQPYQGMGVNMFDAFYRTLLNGNDTSYEAAFEELASRGVRLVRMAGNGFWANDNLLYLNNPEEYFRRFDGVVAAAQKNKIGLIPSLFWADFTVGDMFGEPRNQLGNPASETIKHMRKYIRDVVTRYRSSPAIWGWEMGNEWNLGADLPNAADWRPPTWTNLGCPSYRTAEDDMTHDILFYVTEQFGKEVRKYDPYRALSAGGTEPRPSAWHQWHYLSWTTDTPAQHAEMIGRQNPDPINIVSVHHYDVNYDLAYAMSVSGNLKKPLFVGEYGSGERTGDGTQLPDQEIRDEFYAKYNDIVGYNIPISAVWVFEMPGQNGTWNITATNNRSYQIDAVENANNAMGQ